MSYVDDLKLIVAKHRWAMEELCYDEATKEWNHLCCEGTVKTTFDWLKDQLGSGKAVLDAARTMLLSMRTPVIIDKGSAQADLFFISQCYAWTFEDLVLEQQEKMCLKLFESANAMLAYLVKKKGDGKRVLADLQGLLKVQGQRRKTLYLVED
jgi:hypothetical protein